MAEKGLCKLASESDDSREISFEASSLLLATPGPGHPHHLVSLHRHGSSLSEGQGAGGERGGLQKEDCLFVRSTDIRRFCRMPNGGMTLLNGGQEAQI